MEVRVCHYAVEEEEPGYGAWVALCEEPGECAADAIAHEDKTGVARGFVDVQMLAPYLQRELLQCFHSGYCVMTV